MTAESQQIEITVSGKPVRAAPGETIMHAMWAAGMAGEIQTGCIGGVCGACTVTLRFADGRQGGADLACMRPVAAGMQVFPYPVEPMKTPPPQAHPTADKLRAAFPTLDRCTKCESCTSACPMSIPVMDAVLRMQKGEFESVAEDFTTCIHCGLCRFVCEDRVKPNDMGMWLRRSLGMSRDYPSLEPPPAGDAANLGPQWDYLLPGDAAETLRRARAFRNTGKTGE